MSNILVCDDEKDIVVALKIYLSSDGHTVFEAYNGRQAIDIIHKNNIDLALLDVMMPVMDGLEAASRIRGMGYGLSALPIIAMTANAFDEDRQNAEKAGMNGHLSKPFDMQQLLTMLREKLSP